MDMKQKIIQRFNSQLGSDIKNLQRIYDFHGNLKAEKDEIEKSVSYTCFSKYIYHGKCILMNFII